MYMELKGKKPTKKIVKMLTPVKFCQDVMKNKSKHKVKTIRACIALRGAVEEKKRKDRLKKMQNQRKRLQKKKVRKK